MKLVSLSQLLAQPRPPDQVVARRAGATLGWGELLAGVRATAARLASAPGQRWALFEPDGFRFAIGLLALLHAGKRPLLPANAQPGTVAELAQRVDGFLGAFEGVAALSILEAGAEKGPALAPMPADAAIELMTSGSSGVPRCIHKPLARLDAELACQALLWGDLLADDCEVLASVSHQHIYGLLFRLLLPLLAGRPFHALAYDYNETLYAAAADCGRALVVSSPAHLTRLPPAIDWERVRPRLALLLSSGGPLPAQAARQMQRLAGMAPVEILGSTETGGVGWRRQVQGGDSRQMEGGESRQAEDAESWQPLPGVAVDAGEGGLLRVRSPWADEGEQLMGDRVELLADGRFRLHGRADEVVKLEEKRVSLNELNARLLADPRIAQARVVPLAGPRTRLGAVLVLSEAGRAALQSAGRPALIEELRQHLLQFFERVLLPRKWRLLEELPTNSQGKVTREALQALFTPAPPPPGTLLAQTDGSRRVSIDLDACTGLFDGHFPGLPVLAGVYQLDWAVRHARHWYPAAPFRGVEQLKFREAVPPGLALQLELADRGDGSVDYSYAIGDTVLGSGRIRFGVGDER